MLAAPHSSLTIRWLFSGLTVGYGSNHQSQRVGEVCAGPIASLRLPRASRVRHHFSACMRNPISIRDIRPGDLHEVLRINEESSPGVYLLTLAAAERLTTDATLAWVAVADQGIAGYLIAFIGSAVYAGEEFAWFKERGRNFAYVDQVALTPSYRGRGVGSMLYSELERWGARQLCRSLNCEVNLDPPNPGSLAFHKSYGFIEIGRMHTSDGRHVALLQKELVRGSTPTYGCGL
jgi:predicted GNAT superfamily acetyltransferase